MNYFQIFDFDEVFAIDIEKLTERYQAIQKSVHPDRFAHASDQEQMVAVKKSTLINDAYQTLKNPIKRAEYLLDNRGVDMPSEQASYGDTAFLMRQMELREMLAEVKYADDIDAAIFDVQQTFETEFQQIFKLMQTQIVENSEASNKLACDNLRKLKFYQKLHVELDRLEDLLFED